MADPLKSDEVKPLSGIQLNVNKAEVDMRTEVFKEYFAHRNMDVLMEGVLWSEVLGLPLCKRKGRSIRR
ncbi:MAG: hypothetical protein ACYCYM_07375 [Saccharofermentanales bacterium]